MNPNDYLFPKKKYSYPDNTQWKEDTSKNTPEEHQILQLSTTELFDQLEDSDRLNGSDYDRFWAYHRPLGPTARQIICDELVRRLEPFIKESYFGKKLEELERRIDDMRIENQSLT